MKTRTWKEIKDEVYGMKGTVRRDELERASASFKMGWMLRKAREEKQLTQETLANKVNKKRSFISRIENDGSNMTLKTCMKLWRLDWEVVCTSILRSNRQDSLFHLWRGVLNA